MRADLLVMTKWAFYLALAMGTALTAHAQSSATQVSPTSALTSNEPPMDNGGGPFSGSVSVNRSSSLYDFHDGSRKDGIDYSLKLGLKVSDNYSLGVEGGFSQNLHYTDSVAGESSFSDTNISLGRKAFSLNRYIQFSPTITGIAPTSKESTTVNNLEGAVRIGGTFSLDPVVNPSLALGLGFSGGQNFNEYQTSLDGQPLSQYSFNQTIILGYSWGAFSISGVFIHKDAWTYQGDTRDAFEHFEELDYAINNSWTVAAGHSNSGSTLRANGADSNIALINENDSVIYGSLTLNF